jgi:hypothetical protein
MKKLIQLLNEYEKQFTDRPNYFWYKDKMLWKYIFCELNWRTIDNQELMIISERYEFIKWLVENDKIDFSKYWKVSNEEDRRTEYQNLLMLLSIQDSPIEFLISILK